MRIAILHFLTVNQSFQRKTGHHTLNNYTTRNFNELMQKHATHC